MSEQHLNGAAVEPVKRRGRRPKEIVAPPSEAQLDIERRAKRILKDRRSEVTREMAEARRQATLEVVAEKFVFTLRSLREIQQLLVDNGIVRTQGQASPRQSSSHATATSAPAPDLEEERPVAVPCVVCGHPAHIQPNGTVWRSKKALVGGKLVGGDAYCAVHGREVAIEQNQEAIANIKAAPQSVPAESTGVSMAEAMAAAESEE